MGRKKKTETTQAVETVNVDPAAEKITDFFGTEHEENREILITKNILNSDIEALSDGALVPYSYVKKMIELSHLHIIKEYIDKGDAAKDGGSASVVSENGAFDLRFYNGKLQYKDGTWNDIATAGICEGSVSDTDGIHDIRMLDGKLQYKKNGVWTDVAVENSGGSAGENFPDISIADDSEVKDLFKI